MKQRTEIVKIKDRLHRAIISVRHSPIHGFGVFADEDIQKGSLIEECHVLLADSNTTLFNDYLFSCKKANAVALPLGFGSIYNHSPQSNADYEFDTTLRLMAFTANRDIQTGEEICIDYGRHWFGDRELKIKTPWRYRYRTILAVFRTFWRFGLVVGALTSVLYFTGLMLNG